MSETTKSVLITGGSGLLGSALTDLLLQKGYKVSHLGRSPSMGKVKCYRWSVTGKYVDPKALEGVTAIIHLAGASVAEKRWTPDRKKEILESRTKSGELLFETLRTVPNDVKVVVSATAIGYYGLATADEWCSEDHLPGNDFLADVTKEWEHAIKPVESLSIRLALLRIGVVLSEGGGALVEMARPVKWGVGAPLGTGMQWVSWIHINDLCNMFLVALENENVKGVYNAVAPNPVTNRDLNKAIGQALHRPVWLPPIPDFMLKILIGEMYQIVVSGARVTCDKIKATGFKFVFTDAALAVKDLFSLKISPKSLK
jgi:uncharacterized protein (TIGR01777 family)